jgi:hypothetical protein
VVVLGLVDAQQLPPCGQVDGGVGIGRVMHPPLQDHVLARPGLQWQPGVTGAPITGLGAEVGRPGPRLGQVGVDKAVLLIVRCERQPEQPSLVVPVAGDDVAESDGQAGQVGEGSLVAFVACGDVDRPNLADLVGDIQAVVNPGSERSGDGRDQPVGHRLQVDVDVTVAQRRRNRVMEMPARRGRTSRAEHQRGCQPDDRHHSTWSSARLHPIDLLPGFSYYGRVAQKDSKFPRSTKADQPAVIAAT